VVAIAEAVSIAEDINKIFLFILTPMANMAVGVF
jgi:hypothetical protein